MSEGALPLSGDDVPDVRWSKWAQYGPETVVFPLHVVDGNAVYDSDFKAGPGRGMPVCWVEGPPPPPEFMDALLIAAEIRLKGGPT